MIRNAQPSFSVRLFFFPARKNSACSVLVLSVMLFSSEEENYSVCPELVLSVMGCFQQGRKLFSVLCIGFECDGLFPVRKKIIQHTQYWF